MASYRRRHFCARRVRVDFGGTRRFHAAGFAGAVSTSVHLLLGAVKPTRGASNGTIIR